MAAVNASGVARKIFVGTLPDHVTEALLRNEFQKYGQIVDIFLKTGCEPGRQWAFITFATAEQAMLAKESTDRQLVMPGSERACEVMLAKNQGKFGQEPISGVSSGGYVSAGCGFGASPYSFAGGFGAVQALAPQGGEGARKVFVGTLPDHITDGLLRAEFEKYGHIVDVYLKTGCEPGRQWAFITFATPEQAMLAKESTDRQLVMPGAERACEVMLAKNQGKFGQEPLAGGGGGAFTIYQQPQPAIEASFLGGLQALEMQPPPPSAPPPAHLTPWRCYHTAAGLPYYHNHVTGVTQWECPPELRAPGGHVGAVMAMQGLAQHPIRYSPY